MFEKKIPIYLQLIDVFKQQIVTNKWPPGSYIPSVRELALTYQVNPNTVLKALTELEEQGLLINDGTVGKKVSNDTDLIYLTRQHMLHEYISQFVEQGQSIGYRNDELVEALHTWKGDQYDRN